MLGICQMTQKDMGAACKVARLVVFMDAGMVVEDAAQDSIFTAAGNLEGVGALPAGYFHFAVRPRLARVGA